MSVSTESDTVTPDDITVMNRMVIARAGALARIAGSALVMVGVVGAAAGDETVADD